MILMDDTLSWRCGVFFSFIDCMSFEFSVSFSHSVGYDCCLFDHFTALLGVGMATAGIA